MEPQYPILDHGYIQLVDSWGSDQAIIEAARMSTNKGFQGWGPLHTPECWVNNHHPGDVVGCNCAHNAPGDEKLLKFLWEHKHLSPFEMAGATFEVQAPIFVFREWHRHRTQSYNELSARYTPLPDVHYVPTTERIIEGLRSAGKNKQATGAAELTDPLAINDWLQNLRALYAEIQVVYEQALAAGLPKELARLTVPVGRYSRMRASANLRNWLQFLTLRQAPNAQWEIRQYAIVLGAILETKFPRTMELFRETP